MTFLPSRIQVIKSLAAGETVGDRPLAKILADLNKRLPDEWISFKPVFNRGQQGQKVAYINWTDISLILDYVTNYSWTIEFSENQVGEYLTCKCKITIWGTDKSLTRESLGNEILTSGEQWGGPLSDAQAMAIRRAVALFGLGRYLYYPNLVPAVLGDRPSPSPSPLPKLETELVN